MLTLGGVEVFDFVWIYVCMYVSMWESECVPVCVARCRETGRKGVHREQK